MIIEVKNLKKTYEGKVPTHALKNINFGVKKGEFVALMGRSGSGKSTLLHQLGLLDIPTAGEVIMDGINLMSFTEKEKSEFRLKKLGYVFQSYALLPELTALESVYLPLMLSGVSKKEYIMSKMMMILSMALVSTFFIFIAGLINGSIYSHVHGTEYMFAELEFIAAYFYEIIVYCTLAFLLALVIKKAGFVIVALFLYTIMFEPIIVAIMENAPYFKDGIWPQIAQFFPVKSLNNLINVPFGRYIFMEIKDYIPISAIAITFGWFTFYMSSIVFILNKRDLK